MNILRHIPRWVRIPLFILLGSALALLLVIYLIIQTETGRSYLARVVSTQLSDKDTVVNIGKLSGNLPGQIKLNDLTISDRTGEWLRLDSIHIAWSPFELLQGHLHIMDGRAEGLFVARRPVGRNGPAPDVLSSIVRFLEQPFSLTVDQMSVDNIELAQTVLGETISMRLTGSSMLRAGALLQTQLKIETVAGPPGSVELTVNFDAVGKTLTLDAYLQEPEGGVLARTFNLPQITVNLKGSGPLHNWRAKLQARAHNKASIQAAMSISLQGDQWRVSTSGKADIAYFLGTTEKTLFNNGVSFEANSNFSDLQGIIIESARLSSDAGTFEFDGTLSNQDSDMRARLTFEEPGVQWLNDLNPAVSTSDLILNTRIVGPIFKPYIDLEFEALNPTAGDFTASKLHGQFGLEFDRELTEGVLPVIIRGGGGLEGARSTDPAMDMMLDDQVTWTLDTYLDGDTIKIAQMRLFEDTASISGTGQIGIAAKSVNLDLSIDVPDLARLNPLSDIVRGGRAVLKTKIQTSGSTRGLSAALSGEVDDLLLAEPLANVLTGPRVSMRAKVALEPNGTLLVTNLAVQGDAITLSGDLELSPNLETIQARYQASVENHEGRPPVDMSILLEGSLYGPVTNPTLAGTALFKEVQYNNLSFGSPRASYTVDQITSSPQGHVSISVEESAWGRIDAESQFTVEELTNLRLSGLHLESQEFLADGELLIPFDSGPILGSVNGSIADLEVWSAIVPHELEGQISFDIVLGEKDALQTANIRALAKDIVIDLDSLQPVTSNSLDVSAKIRDPFSAPHGDLSIEAKGAKFGNANLAQFLLDIDMIDADRAAINLALNGDLHGPLEIRASGKAAWPEGVVEAALDKLQGQVLGHLLELMQPAQVLLGPEQLAIDGLRLMIAGGEIRADGDIGPDNMDINLRLSRLPLGLIDILRAGTGLQGTLSGGVQLVGPRVNPVGRAELKLAAARVATVGAAQVPGIDGLLSGAWKDNRLTMRGELTGFSKTALTLNGELPLHLAPDSLRLEIPRIEPISGRILWRGEIEPLFELLGLHDHHVSGLADLVVNLDGSLDAPAVNGTLELSGGEYENRVSGTLITNAAIKLASDGQRIAAEGSANDGGDGRVSIRGSMELVASLPINLELEVNKAVLVRLDELTASASGQATLSGPITSSVLSGQLVVGKVEARIVDNAAGKVVELEVLEINLPRDAARRDDKSKPKDPAVIHLDVRLDMPGKVFLRGRGLESEWAGVLQVSGTDGSPIIGGELRPVRGGFSFAGKEFKLRTGSVRFDETDDIDPILNLPGEYSGQDTTAIISITGRASNPEIKFTSRPPLPESQILSHVLFDKDAEELSTGQKIELAAALATLTGSGSGGVLDKARRSLGVDTLALRESQDGTGARISAGKYLTDKVYVELEKGAREEPGTATIELEVAPRVKVETGSKGNGDGKVGIKWRWDY